MNDYVLIGKIVNTHGVKGEIRLISDFELKNKVFIPGFTIYIGQIKEENTIVSYRHHKMFDMLLLKNKNDIDEVINYKSKYVYAKRKDLGLKENEYLLEELINYEVIEDKKNVGKIVDVVYNNKQVLLKVKNLKEFYIPFVEEYIVKVDNITKKVQVKNAKDLIL